MRLGGVVFSGEVDGVARRESQAGALGGGRVVHLLAGKACQQAGIAHDSLVAELDQGVWLQVEKGPLLQTLMF